MSAPSDSWKPPRRAACAAYLEVGLASLANGSIGVKWSLCRHAHERCCSACAMLFAAVALGIVVLATGSWRDLRRPGAPSACWASASPWR